MQFTYIIVIYVKRSILLSTTIICICIKIQFGRIQIIINACVLYARYKIVNTFADNGIKVPLMLKKFRFFMHKSRILVFFFFVNGVQYTISKKNLYTMKKNIIILEIVIELYMQDKFSVSILCNLYFLSVHFKLCLRLLKYLIVLNLIN